MRLTRPNVARLTLPPGKNDLLIFDDDLPGFGIRLRAGGKKVWIAQYRVGRQQRRVTLGPVGTLDPDEARKRARSTLARVHLGEDPQASKAEARARAVVTLDAVTDRYLVATQARLRARSHAAAQLALVKHLAPLRGVPLHSITRAMVAGNLGDIAMKSGPFASNRARASLSALFAWAMGEGLADANPVVGTNTAAEYVSRDHVLTDDELVAIWKACRDDDYGRIVRLLILTGQRREEVGGIASAEIDFHAAIWTIPRERSKNRRDHHVPLSVPAMEIVRADPIRDGHTLLFGTGRRGFQGWSKAKAAMDARVAKGPIQVRPWRLHDLRRTVATEMADRLGILPHVVEAVLNHVSGHKAGVAGTYNRAVYATEKRQALDRWAERVMALINGGESKIVAFRVER